jgi:hypothetical protein
MFRAFKKNINSKDARIKELEGQLKAVCEAHKLLETAIKQFVEWNTILKKQLSLEDQKILLEQVLKLSPYN